MSEDNIVEFRVPPKKLKRQYKKQEYTLTYLPPSRSWRWEIIFVSRTKYDGEATTMNKAIRAAEKFIDETMSVRGSK